MTKKKPVYYHVFVAEDGTILDVRQTYKPRKSSMRPRIKIDEDGVHTEWTQSLDDWNSFSDWAKGSYTTTMATRLNLRRTLRELVLPRLDGVERQLASIQEKLDRIENSRNAL